VRKAAPARSRLEILTLLHALADQLGIAAANAEVYQEAARAGGIRQ